MKIKSYKGRSLDRIYGAIRRDLGPEAMVVSTHRAGGVKGIFSSVMGGGEYEIVAVADDQAVENHLLADLPAREDILDLYRLESERWRGMESTVNALREQVQGLHNSGGMAFSAGAMADSASDWDPRFVAMLRKAMPDFFESEDQKIRRAALASLVPVKDPLALSGKGNPHVIVFVGPTGSGKTTTVAKLASRWSLNEKRKVGLVSTDTYRIAAVDQIREYATLLGLDLRVAFSSAEAAKAVKSLPGREVILVDTAGRNHYDEASITALRGVLQGMGGVTVMLLLPATMDRRLAAETLQHYRPLNPKCVVITKVDEARRLGVLTTVLSETALPISFLTDGQNVPQNIVSADADEIAGRLMGEIAGCD